MSKSCQVFVSSLLLGITVGSQQMAQAWDPVRDLTGKSLKGNIEDRAHSIEQSARKFLHNPIDYTLRFPQKLVSQLCAAVPMTYEGTLQGQVGQWWSIPDALINDAQPFYSVNLRGVRFAVDIRTANGAAQTFGNSIYFPARINLNDPNDLWWMFHELEHVVQYENSSWGTSGKLCEYMWKGIKSGFDHDSHSMEQAADRKADFVMRMLGSNGNAAQLPINQLAVTNHNQHNVVFYLRTQTFGETIVMQPQENRIFRGAPNDNWFYIEVPNNSGPPATYTLNGGTKQHIVRSPTGLLDVMWSN